MGQYGSFPAYASWVCNCSRAMLRYLMPIHTSLILAFPFQWRVWRSGLETCCMAISTGCSRSPTTSPGKFQPLRRSNGNPKKKLFSSVRPTTFHSRNYEKQLSIWLSDITGARQRRLVYTIERGTTHEL